MVFENKHRLIHKLGHDFSDETLVELALTHRSVGATNNERLEFLGDSIVNFVIGEALFNKFPEVKEGTLSQMRAQLVKGKTLAEIAREFDIGEYLSLGPGELKSGGFRRESILADAVEALIGAIYIDSGMEACKACILRWYGTRLDAISPKNNIKDAKTLLQEWLQARKEKLPIYHLLRSSDEDQQHLFEVECEVAGFKQRFKGEGSNRRNAEQSAATLALAALQNT